MVCLVLFINQSNIHICFDNATASQKISVKFSRANLTTWRSAQPSPTTKSRHQGIQNKRNRKEDAVNSHTQKHFSDMISVVSTGVRPCVCFKC